MVHTVGMASHPDRRINGLYETIIIPTKNKLIEPIHHADQIKRAT